MKNTIQKFLLIFAIICMFSCNSYAQTCNDNAYYMLKDSTVKIRIETNNDRYYGCTGIIIHEDENSTGILTAQHCIANAREVYVDGKYLVTSIQASKRIDVAYLVISDSIMHKSAIKLARYNISVGDKIFNLGYPGWGELYDCGVVLSSSAKYFISSSSVIGGCSGSGVLNIYGELTGILWGGYIGNKDFEEPPSIITHIKEIRKFLKSINYLKKEVILIK